MDLNLQAVFWTGIRPDGSPINRASVPIAGPDSSGFSFLNPACLLSACRSPDSSGLYRGNGTGGIETEGRKCLFTFRIHHKSIGGVSPESHPSKSRPLRQYDNCHKHCIVAYFRHFFKGHMTSGLTEMDATRTGLLNGWRATGRYSAIGGKHYMIILYMGRCAMNPALSRRCG